MNRYAEMIKRHQAEINNFNLGFAFSPDQYNEMLAKWNIKPEDAKNEILSIGGGGYVRRVDEPELIEICSRHSKELKEAIAADTIGNGFILDMFEYELSNHEYCYTRELDETLEACNLNFEDLEENPALKNGLNEALKMYHDVFYKP